jgi:hypothetical protein
MERGCGLVLTKIIFISVLPISEAAETFQGIMHLGMVQNNRI